MKNVFFKLHLFLLLVVVCGMARAQNTNNGDVKNNAPAGITPLLIASVFPISATTGDTVTIILRLPVTVTAVKFGNVPAASLSGQQSGVIKAVVGGGASGKVTVVGTLQGGGIDSMAGFTFIPPSADIDVSLCGPVANTSLVSNITGASYQWQLSPDGISYTEVLDDTTYIGSQTNKLRLMNIKSSYNGYKYRCIVNGNHGKVFTLKFENVWIGHIVQEWENPYNWSCNVIPGINTNVVITQGTVTVAQNTTVESLTLKPGVILTVKPGVILKVTH